MVLGDVPMKDPIFSNFAKVSSRSFPRAASAVHPTAPVFLGGSSCQALNLQGGVPQ